MSDEAGPAGEKLPSSDESAEEDAVHTRLSFRFTGTTAEYFRIWIVNLCLTMFTFGVFSAWAKVRKQRYFYSHTLLGRTPFQYLGRPIPILKGRLVAAALALSWYAVGNLTPEFGWLVALAALGLAPWVITRSVAFRARYSGFRNLTFSFRGSYWGLAKTLYGWLLVSLIACGLAYPVFRQRLARYLVVHTEFGGVRARFLGTAGQFIGPYLVAGVLVVVTAIGPLLATVKYPASGRGWAAAMVGIYLGYFVAFTYLRARITNLIWNRTELGPVRFVSTLSARSLLWIYLTNTLAVIASLGLLVPWAAIRTLRYRSEHFAVFAAGALGEFEGSHPSTVRAVGAEVGELFDLDIAL